MKNKKIDQKVFSFYSISSPCDFTARIKEEAIGSNLNIEQNDTGFNLQLDSNHGGRIVYKATVIEENGGSYISGEIATIPWSDKPNKKKSIIEKIFSVIGYIVVFPFMLIFLLFYGIYTLFVRLFRGKSIETTKEDKLCDFMINKMCCKQK
ncbi:MAG: hypothetical protein IJY39_02200 [Clostridia bacterium]|nr:hypothetical protein [Clostridia bacterium]